MLTVVVSAHKLDLISVHYDTEVLLFLAHQIVISICWVMNQLEIFRKRMAAI